MDDEPEKHGTASMSFRRRRQEFPFIPGTAITMLQLY